MILSSRLLIIRNAVTHRAMRVAVVHVRRRRRLVGIVRNMRRAGWPDTSIASALKVERGRVVELTAGGGSMWGSLLAEAA